MAVEIKSSLLNENDLKGVKNSIIKVSEKDGKENFRVRLIEYINDSSENDDDMFFYDMLEFSRFLDPDDPGAVAYTTPDHLIYMNAPNDSIGESYRKWDFVYDHECLHQLWDTFGVAEKIKEKYGDYDHMVLNIASDCVINDYLYAIRKKERPDDLITPELIKEQFGVDYDRKYDTQFTLYEKIMKSVEKQKNLMDELMKDPIFKKIIEDMKKEDQQSQGGIQAGSQGQQGQGGNQGQQGQNGNQGQQSQDGNQGQQSQGGGQGGSNGNTDGSGNGKTDGSGSSNSNSDIDNMSADEAAADAQKSAEAAQNAADKAKDNAKKSGSNEDKEAADKAQEAADKAKAAADKAKEAANKGNKKEAQDAAKEARNAAKEAQDAANGKTGNGDKNAGNGAGTGAGTTEQEEVDVEKIKHKAEQIIEKYSKKLTGALGEFISKCRVSASLKTDGLKVGTQAGNLSWNQEMTTYINSFVRKKVFQKKRMVERTYKRPNRRSGVVEIGAPLVKGKRIRKDSLSINTAFYIDRSGSMSNINDVFKAAYTLCDVIKKKFGKESVVDDIAFKMHAFDYDMHELAFGKKMSADGGTMDFGSILEYIKDHTQDYMINVIITDAQFSIDRNKVTKFIKDINGMLLFITNYDNEEMKQLAKQYNTQLFYILADKDFTIKN